MVLPLLELFDVFWKGQHPGHPCPRRQGRRRPGPQAAGAV